MRFYLDENDKKNEIRLLLKHPLYKDKVIIVVEGMTDVRLFRYLFDEEQLRLETVDGKSKLIEVMKGLVQEYPNQLLGICDADFDNFFQNSAQYKQYNIFMTDEHDAEIMMLKSPSLISFLAEYAFEENRIELEQSLFRSALNAGYHIGILRLINSKEQLNINFKGLNFNIFLDISNINISVNTEYLIDELLQRSPSKQSFVNKSYLENKISECFEDQKEEALQICCGHDLTKIIAMIFRQRWASLETNFDSRKVESSLRIGFQKDFFKSTQLFKDVENALTSFGFPLTSFS